MSDLAFQWETVETLLAEPNIRELVLAQHDEFSGLPESIPLEIDTERMIAAEKIGAFKIWTARQDGMLIGLIEFCISPAWHHRSTLFAFDCGHYLAPEFRSTHIALKMWRSGLEALRELGVQVVMAHDNPRRPLAPFFKRLGFMPPGQWYAQVL